MDVLWSSKNKSKLSSPLVCTNLITINILNLNNKKSIIILGITGNLKNITIVKMNLKSLFHGRYSLSDKQQLYKLIANGIKSGEVQPLPTILYTNEKELEEAFR